MTTRCSALPSLILRHAEDEDPDLHLYSSELACPSRYLLSKARHVLGNPPSWNGFNNSCKLSDPSADEQMKSRKRDDNQRIYDGDKG